MLRIIKRIKINILVSSEELREFFEDGKEILRYIKKNRGGYFNKKGWYLVGCEVPLIIVA